MRLPSLPRDGMSVAKICTDLINYLKVSRLTSVKGGRLRQTPSGQVLEIDTPPTPDPGIAPPLWVTPFYDADDTEWKYNVNVGHVTEQNIGVSSVIEYYVPTLDGTPIDADPAPIGVLPANDCKIYLQVSTDNKGRITSTPTIVSSTSDETSTHHTPPSPGSSGVNGDYYFLIAEFEENTESTIGSPLEVKRIPGNRMIPNQLVDNDNLGSGSRVYSHYDSGATDQHQFRSVSGRGAYSSDSPDPGTTEQINTVEDGGEIRVLGNGKKGDLTVTDSDGIESSPVLEWNDGLVTSESATIQLPVPGGDSTHPWKATENGNATIDIAAGNVLRMVSEGGLAADTTPQWVHLDKAASYAGGTVTVEVGDSYIYGRIPLVEAIVYTTPDPSDPVNLNTRRLQPSGSVTVEAGGAMPASGDQFVFLIAEVSLNAGVATIDDQVLTHNPQLHSYQVKIESS
jgi:hypothetical protein